MHSLHESSSWPLSHRCGDDSISDLEDAVHTAYVQAYAGKFLASQVPVPAANTHQKEEHSGKLLTD